MCVAGGTQVARGGECAFRPCLHAPRSRRTTILDPGARLGDGEENRVPGLRFERRLGLGLIQNSLNGRERLRGPRQADDGDARDDPAGPVGHVLTMSFAQGRIRNIARRGPAGSPQTADPPASRGAVCLVQLRTADGLLMTARPRGGRASCVACRADVQAVHSPDRSAATISTIP
jgi:hypothetical protein